MRLAEELVEYCGRVDAALRGRCRHLNDHLNRAAASALTNTGEALDDESMGDKARLFRYAYRSCGEAERSLRGLRVAGALSEPLLAEGFRRVKNVKMDLLRLMAWAKRTR